MHTSTLKVHYTAIGTLHAVDALLPLRRCTADTLVHQITSLNLVGISNPYLHSPVSTCRPAPAHTTRQASACHLAQPTGYLSAGGAAAAGLV